MNIRSVLLLAAASAAGAAELVIRDIGAEVELPATAFDFTVDDGSSSRSGSDSFEQAVGISIGGRWSFARTGDSSGPVLGISLAADRAAYPGGGSWFQSEVRGQAGWGWALNDRFAVLAEALLGLGAARLTIDGSGDFPSYSARGGILEPGAQAVLLWSVTDSWVVSGTAGYRYARAHLTGDDADVDLTLRGIAVAVGVAWRITDRPFLLE